MTGTKQLPAIPAETLPYEVGYRKPPIQHQFGNGQKINRKGRPKGSKNKQPTLRQMDDIILEEAYRDVKINDGDRQVTAPLVRAVMRSLSHSAAKGGLRAQKLFTDLLSATETRRANAEREIDEVVLGYKAEWERELERRERLGITDGERPLIHPKQIHFDPRSGEITLLGPLTREERELYERQKADDAEMALIIVERLAAWEEELKTAKGRRRTRIKTAIELNTQFLMNLQAKAPWEE